ncbi:hypothetical protein ACMFMG_007776 [Clarireedia jacksonii]
MMDTAVVFIRIYSSVRTTSSMSDCSSAFFYRLCRYCNDDQTASIRSIHHHIQQSMLRRTAQHLARRQAAPPSRDFPVMRPRMPAGRLKRKACSLMSLQRTAHGTPSSLPRKKQIVSAQGSILRMSGSPYGPDSGRQFNDEMTAREAVSVSNRYDWGYYDKRGKEEELGISIEN